MEKPSLLLHACCAPCTPHVYKLLSEDYNVIVYFYNPNIQLEDEYRKREDEIIKFAEKEGIELIVGNYDEGAWMDSIYMLEGEPEGGKRCTVCFKFRLDRAAIEASVRNIKYFTTTLSVSPHKNADVINREGVQAAERYGLEFIESNFKKNDGYKISCELSREHGFYRQDYCGCIFSR